MSRNSVRIVCLLAVAALCGCAVAPGKVVLPRSASQHPSFVEDRREPDRYPGFMAGEGNIYSCRYGIRLIPSTSFDPPKTQVLEDALSARAPDIASHRVVLERFDVYYNWRLRLLRTVAENQGISTGAIVRSMALNAANQNKDVVAESDFWVDAEPLRQRTGHKQVGCDDAKEGEYYASEVSARHDVVVVWLSFSVDDQPIQIRTFYQFMFGSNDEIYSQLAKAVQLSVAAGAERISSISSQE